MNITCVVNSLGGGGAERAMLHLSGGLARRGHRVTLLTLDGSVPDFYAVPPGVSRSVLAGASGSCRWFQVWRQANRLLTLRRTIASRQPAAVISFVDVTNVLTLAACWGMPVPVIVCEQINPRHYSLSPHWDLFRRRLYRTAANIVMLTPDTLDWARSIAPAVTSVAIPSPMPLPVFSEKAPRPDFFGKGKNLIAMGRLTPQKGFDILLPAFASIAGENPDWQLTILGEGPERAKLEALRHALGLDDRVALPGTRPEPYDVLKQADLFVMSSRFEGFGMALAEALACGLPAVSFDCPSGPSLIIRDGIDGVLVPAGDAAGLAGALAGLMSDESRRKAMASRSLEVTDRLSVDKYLDEWEKLLTGL